MLNFTKRGKIVTSSILLAFREGVLACLQGRNMFWWRPCMAYIFGCQCRLGTKGCIPTSQFGSQIILRLCHTLTKDLYTLCVHRSEYIYPYISGMRTWILMGSIEFSPNWKDRCRIRNITWKGRFYSVEKKPAKKSTSRYWLFFCSNKIKTSLIEQKKTPTEHYIGSKKAN